MTIQSIFILSGDSGDVILEKHYAGVTSRSSVEVFWEEVSKRTKRDDVPPIIVSAKYYLVNIYRGGLYFLATLTSELAALSTIEFLHRLYDVFEGYFGEVSPASLTSSFSTAYQLMEEMMDGGHPVITEPNALTSLIAPPSVLGKVAGFLVGKTSAVSETLGESAMSIIPWRRSGVKYAQNEILFDIVEEVDAIYESNGTLVSADVRGTVHCTSRMSGVPDLTLVFNTPGVIEDCSFHPCVRYARWERESVVSFVPPDGPFVLMTYRLADKNPSIPVGCRPSVTWREGGARATFTLQTKPIYHTKTGGGAAGGAGVALSGSAAPGDAGMAIEGVRLVVSVPKAVKSCDLNSETGTVMTDPRTGDVTWALRSMPKDKSPELGGLLHTTPGAPLPIEPVSATLHFSAPNGSVSGLTVKDLLLVSDKYPFFKGARTAIRSGRIQIRT